MAQLMILNKLKFMDGEALFKRYIEMGKGGSIAKLARFAQQQGWNNPKTGKMPTRVGVWCSMWRWALRNPQEARKIYDQYVLEFGQNLTDEMWYSLLEARAQKLLLFEKSEYAAHRARLMERIPDGAAILLGATLPTGGEFFQNNDLMYFTGVEIPDVALIVADQRRLYNAFFNLINNAIPEVPPGGSVTVRGQTSTPEGSVVVSVIDTGRGMPPEVRDRLFTKRVISTKPGGTGLGTKIVKDVVDAHGGTIWVESELGAGTTIHIRLPHAPKDSSRSSGDRLV